MEDLRTCSFTIRGFSTRSFWTTDPSLLKGFHCSSFSYVPVLLLVGVVGRQGRESLVLVTAGSKSSLLCAFISCMTCGFGLLILKGNSHLVGNRTGPFCTGFVVTVTEHQINYKEGPPLKMELSSGGCVPCSTNFLC